MRCINYKCSNCNGKVQYNQEKNKWICTYCGHQYQTLYKTTGLKIKETEKEKEIKKEYYTNICGNCNTKQISSKKYDKCPKCSQNINCEKIVTNSLYFPKNTENIFNTKEYQNIKFKYKSNNDMKFIKFLVCNGEIIINYKIDNSIYERRYVFLDMCIPIDDTLKSDIRRKMSYLDYSVIKNEQNNCSDELFTIKKDLNKERKDDCIEKIINECVNNLIEEKNIKNDNIINIENSLEKVDEIYVPFYTGKLLYKEKENLMYQLALYNESNPEEYIMEDYKIKNNIKLYVKIRTISVLIFAFLLLYYFIKQDFYNLYIILATLVSFFVAYAIAAYIKYGCSYVIKKNAKNESKNIFNNNNIIRKIDSHKY